MAGRGAGRHSANAAAGHGRAAAGAGPVARRARRPPAGGDRLLLAGATALYDDAGQLPSRAAPAEWYLPALRAAGERPPCSPAATRFLERMLNQQHTDLLPELLGLLDAAGQRLADEVLPHALAHGARIPRVRPALLPVLGERGRLAAINPDWRYAAVAPGYLRSLRAAWERDPAGRPALALLLRRNHPALALRLIESTWRDAADAPRRELLAALATGLSMDDEPFLERPRTATATPKCARRRRRCWRCWRSPRLVRRMVAAMGDSWTLDGGHLTPDFPPVIPQALVRTA